MFPFQPVFVLRLRDNTSAAGAAFAMIARRSFTAYRVQMWPPSQSLVFLLCVCSADWGFAIQTVQMHYQATIGERGITTSNQPGAQLDIRHPMTVSRQNRKTANVTITSFMLVVLWSKLRLSRESFLHQPTHIVVNFVLTIRLIRRGKWHVLYGGKRSVDVHVINV